MGCTYSRPLPVIGGIIGMHCDVKGTSEKAFIAKMEHKGARLTSLNIRP